MRPIFVTGQVLVAAGSIAAAVSIQVWDVEQRFSIVFTVVAIAAAVLAILALVLVRSASWLAALSSILPPFLLGTLRVEYLSVPDADAEYLFAIAGSGIATVGGLVALLGLLASAPGAVAAGAPRQPEVAAGWYTDPSGQARLRYWTGSAWSEETAT